PGSARRLGGRARAERLRARQALEEDALALLHVDGDAAEASERGVIPADRLREQLGVAVLHRSETAPEVHERALPRHGAALAHEAGEDRVVAAGEALVHVADEVGDG